MSGEPRTWAELMSRFTALLGNPDGFGYATAEHWIMEACEATWGAIMPRLSKTRRQIAFQRACGALALLEAEPGDLAFALGLRAITRRAFVRYWKGVRLDGPPWRLDPAEDALPTYEAWSASADFE